VSRVQWQEAWRQPGATLRQIRRFPSEVRRARLARDTARTELAEAQAGLRKTSGKLRAAREEVRNALGPLRVDLGEAKAEIEALHRLYETDEVPEAVRDAIRAMRREPGAPSVRLLLELAEAGGAARGVPGGFWVLGDTDPAVPRMLGVAGGADRVNVPSNGGLPDGPAALAHLAGAGVDRLIEVSERLTPGGRILVEGYRSPDVRRLVARFTDEHAGLLSVRGALLHLIPESD
jgi:hypothetical protein